MGWPSRLTYQQIASTGIKRSLTVLAAYGDLETTRTILQADPSLADDPEALANAAENGHESIVRLLLQHCPGLAERIAVVARTPELTRFLFENGMNPNLIGWLGVTPLHRFARQGDIEKAAVFLDHGADLHARDEEFCTTPLGYAVLAGKRRMIEFLLQRGARVATPDDLGWATPIALARYRRDEQIIRLLTTWADLQREAARERPV
jgi:ankyrin repeat protein